MDKLVFRNAHSRNARSEKSGRNQILDITR